MGYNEPHPVDLLSEEVWERAGGGGCVCICWEIIYVGGVGLGDRRACV